MSNPVRDKKINSPLGILFQIPVFFVAIYGLYNLIETFCYSFTDFDMVNKPTFAGVGNYVLVFKEKVIRNSLGNTVLVVCAVAVLLIFTAVLPAIFTARLKLPFGIGVMCAFSLISLCTMLPGFWSTVFSDSAYGTLNSWLLSSSLINTPVAFIQSLAMPIAITVFWLYCLAPVFFVTYIAARLKHSFLGVAIAVCLIPVLMFIGSGTVTGVIGYPSANYAGDWLYTVFKAYLTVQYKAGLACAVLVVGLIMLAGWCVTVCSVAFGLWAIFRRINTGSKAFKVFGMLSFAFAALLFVLALPVILTHFSKAFMPLDELMAFPGFIPKRPTLQNFSNFAGIVSSSSLPFSRYLINSLLIVPLTVMPVCFSVALPSGVGFGAFRAFKRQNLLLLCFIPFLFVSGYIALNKLGIIDSYLVYAFKFLSSFEFFTALFSVYLAAKLVFYNRKPDVSGILLGVLFILSSFYAAGAIRGIWYYSGGYIFDEKLKLWRDVSAVLAMGGATRSGVVAASNILMLLATAAVVIVPLLLLLILYVLYRKKDNTRQNAEL